jgi:hypothetical protein
LTRIEAEEDRYSKMGVASISSGLQKKGKMRSSYVDTSPIQAQGKERGFLSVQFEKKSEKRRTFSRDHDFGS